MVGVLEITMEVTILERKQNIQVTSVIIGLDKNDPNGEMLHMFFCPNCQNPICQYKGRLVSIMPGASPLKLPVLIRCRCKRVYQIDDVV